MRKRKDGYAIIIRPINNGERKALEKNSPSIFGGGRTRKREGQGTSRCVLDSRSKTRAEAGLLLVVVDDFGQKLAPVLQRRI